MQRVSFITTETNGFTPQHSALIVDKTGIIGEELAKKLSEELLVVYVSKKISVALNSSKNIIHVPYNSKLPAIPKNNYSYAFIVDDETKVIRGSLRKFIEKAEKDNSCLIFLTHILEINQKPILNIVSKPRGAKIIIYGDIFGRLRIHDYKTSQFIVNKFIERVQRFGEIKVFGDGLRITYPVFLDDVIDAILKVVFVQHDISSIFYLFPKHAPTEISLAHMIQKANPNLRIDFVREKRKERKSIILPQNGKYLLEDNYKLHERLRKIFLEVPTQHPINGISEYFETKKNNFNLLPLFGLLCLVIILLLPLITTFLFSFLGFKMLESAKEEIDRGRLINAHKLINSSSAYFYLAKKTLATLLLEARIVGKENSVESIFLSIRLGEDMSTGGLYFIESVNLFSKVFMNQSKNPKEDFILAQTMLKNSMVLLQKIQAENKLSSNLNALILDFDPLIKLTSGSIDILPSIFGFEGAKTYLILFQNNMELRPGGGFIGSYALLTMKEGIVKDFSIHDVYDADRRLKGHVEPPYPIRRLIPVEHWYLRDSNFDIDFAKSASKSAFFLDIETGKKADGVIGLDVSFAKNLISAIGPIYLTDYKQLVDKNNLFKLTKNIEKDLFPGLRQKRDFLGSLYEAILSDISQKKNLQYLSLIKIVSNSMLQKHLLFAFASPTIQDFFTVNNWSSTLWDKRQDRQDIINDFVGINEANLGGNNVNYNIQRKVSQNITLDNKGKVFGELSILYDNTSSSSLLNGDYKNYLRIILQPDSDLSSITIDNVKQSIVKAITDPKIYESKNFVLPKGLEVDKTQTEGKTVYGFLTNIKAGKKQTITVKYSLSKRAPLTQSLFAYNLRFFKQPGTDEYPFTFSLSHPLFYNPINMPEEFIKKDGKIFLSKTLNSDYEFSISLAKQ